MKKTLFDAVIPFALAGAILLTGCAEIRTDENLASQAPSLTDGYYSSDVTAAGTQPEADPTYAEETTAAETTVAETTVAETTSSVFYDPESGIYYDHSEIKGEISQQFELPLVGSTGFTPTISDVYEEASESSAAVVTLSPGDAFVILEEKDGEWWRITQDGSWEGWIKNIYCFLNIPDVIPSIVFDNTNAVASVFVSSGKSIPDITGQQLYESRLWNGRFEADAFVVAANYGMVKKIYEAQKAALSEGYTLVINETFRPLDVQIDVAAQLQVLYDQDSEVRAGIDSPPWDISWFITYGVSTHQLGCAMDVSLAKVDRMEIKLSGKYQYAAVTEYTPCDMPTPIHELSSAAVSLEKPVNSRSKTKWKDVLPSESMTQDALRLKDYCTGAGLCPLASEWWHFNDLDAKEATDSYTVDGAFRLNDCLSRIPE